MNSTRFLLRLRIAASKTIVEEADWECGSCRTFNLKKLVACHSCGASPISGRPKARRVTRANVEAMYGPDPPTRHTIAPEATPLSTQSLGRNMLPHSSAEDDLQSTQPGHDEGEKKVFGQPQSPRNPPGHSTEWRGPSGRTLGGGEDFFNDGAGFLGDDEEDYAVKRQRLADAGMGTSSKIKISIASVRGTKSYGTPRITSRSHRKPVDEVDGKGVNDEEEEENEEELGAIDVMKPESKHIFDDFYGQASTASSKNGKEAGSHRASQDFNGEETVRRQKVLQYETKSARAFKYRR